MKEYIQKIQKHLKEGTLQKMWTQTLWIGQYAKRYWKAILLSNIVLHTVRSTGSESTSSEAYPLSNVSGSFEYILSSCFYFLVLLINPLPDHLYR